MVKALDCLGKDDIVIACSGGLDSTVLAHAAALHVRLYGGDGKLTLAYVNHRLRPEENIKEITHIRHLSKPLKADWVVLLAPIDSGPGVQEQARKKRYDVLSQSCEAHGKRTNLLTAHNANDQAETVLFRTLTGRQNVRIPQAVNTEWGGIFRPFLEFTRDDIAQYARVWSLGWCEDSSNATDKYTRNKIRHQLLPWIEANINPSVVKTLMKPPPEEWR